MCDCFGCLYCREKNHYTTQCPELPVNHIHYCPGCFQHNCPAESGWQKVRNTLPRICSMSTAAACGSIPPQSSFGSFSSLIQSNPLPKSIETSSLKARFTLDCCYEKHDDPHLMHVALTAVKLYNFIRANDFLLSRIKTSDGQRKSITGTGAFGSMTSAQKRGYSTIFSVIENAILLSGMSIQEAQILGVGLFLHGSDIFYLVARSYRCLSFDTDEAQKIAADMKLVHQTAFDIVKANPEKVQTEYSLDPRFRSIGLDMLEALEIQTQENETKSIGPFAPNLTRRSLLHRRLWEGKFLDNSTLCTGVDLLGSYRAFASSARYNIDEKGYGLILVSGTVTYNYSNLSPFPQEEEWIVLPSTSFESVVYKRDPAEPLSLFFDYIVNCSIGSLRSPYWKFDQPTISKWSFIERFINPSLALILDSIAAIKCPSEKALRNLSYLICLTPTEISHESFHSLRPICNQSIKEKFERARPFMD